MRWIRVHKLPDYAYFAHNAHVAAGIGCVTCHGRIDEMETVTQMTPLSMSWCLDCHRNPGPNRRPVSEVTNMKWTPPRTGRSRRSSSANDRSIRRLTVRGATGDTDILAKSRAARGAPRIPRLSRAGVPGGRLGASRRGHPARHDDAPGRLAVARGARGCRRPVEEIVPYVTAPRRSSPDPRYYATTMPFRPERLRPDRREPRRATDQDRGNPRTPRPSGPRARASRRPCSASTIPTARNRSRSRERSPGAIS